MGVSVWIAADTIGYLSGGHLWAYLNWALGLKGIGCEVVWMERDGDPANPQARQALADCLRRRGLERICLYDGEGCDAPSHGDQLVSVEQAGEADLLLNLAYAVPPALVARFRRSAMLDIDPGMTQTWLAARDIDIAPHDVFLTTGEGIAEGTAPVPDCGISWLYAPPCVALDAWPVTPPPPDGSYTTVTHWWEENLFVMPDGSCIDNSKRVSYLPYLPVARRAVVHLDVAVGVDDLEDDAALLEEHGWSITDPTLAAGTPERYRSYIQRSRGEFSCAKPAYRALDTGWISDRTVCYLASGRPAVLQDTGPCRLLDEATGEGVLRFRTPEEAIHGLAAVEEDHERQCQFARRVAEEAFDARKRAGRLLEQCLP